MNLFYFSGKLILRIYQQTLSQEYRVNGELPVRLIKLRKDI
jgi:hypothetical protein